MQEQRTARIAADWLRQQGYEVTEKIGGTGVVGLLRNGEGATVLLRADMDGLPMKENTGLPGRLNDLPSNHSPQFAPVLSPTLRVGIEAMLTAAEPWLATAGAKR